MWLPWRGCEGSAPTAAAGLDGSGGVGTGGRACRRIHSPHRCGAPSLQARHKPA